jgi:hypothetical protein
MLEMRYAHRMVAGKPERKRPLTRPSLRCEDDIKMDLSELRWIVWTGFIWLRRGALWSQ